MSPFLTSAVLACSCQTLWRAEQARQRQLGPHSMAQGSHIHCQQGPQPPSTSTLAGGSQILPEVVPHKWGPQGVVPGSQRVSLIRAAGEGSERSEGAGEHSLPNVPLKIPLTMGRALKDCQEAPCLSKDQGSLYPQRQKGREIALGRRKAAHRSRREKVGVPRPAGAGRPWRPRRPQHGEKNTERDLAGSRAPGRRHLVKDSRVTAPGGRKADWSRCGPGRHGPVRGQSEDRPGVVIPCSV